VLVVSVSGRSFCEVRRSITACRQGVKIRRLADAVGLCYDRTEW
jgi:hypothetical protein